MSVQGNPRVPPTLSSLSHCLGQMGLAYPFWGHILKKKKKGIIKISIIKPLYQKILSKTSYGARLCKPWMSHERDGTNRLFYIATLVLHLSVNRLFTLSNPTSHCCIQIWNMNSLRLVHLDGSNTQHCA